MLFSDQPGYLCIVRGFLFPAAQLGFFRLSHNVVSFSAAITSCEAGRGSQITLAGLRLAEFDWKDWDLQFWEMIKKNE